MRRFFTSLLFVLAHLRMRRRSICNVYNGPTFWSSAHCGHYNALIKRMESLADAPSESRCCKLKAREIGRRWRRRRMLSSMVSTARARSTSADQSRGLAVAAPEVMILTATHGGHQLLLSILSTRASATTRLTHLAARMLPLELPRQCPLPVRSEVASRKILASKISTAMLFPFCW